MEPQPTISLWDPDEHLPPEKQDRYLIITSTMSLVAYGCLLRSFKKHDLMRGNMGNLLLLMVTSAAVFNVAGVITSLPISMELCQWWSLAQLWSLFASPLYFLMLTWHLWDLASNPFAMASTWILHFLALSISVVLAEWMYRSDAIQDVFTEKYQTNITCLPVASQATVCVHCPHVFLYDWATFQFSRLTYAIGVGPMMLGFLDLRAALGEKAYVFTKRKQVILKSLLAILSVNAVFYVVMPTAIWYIKMVLHEAKWCVIAECALLGIATVVPAMVWMSVFWLYADDLERATAEFDGELAEDLRKEVVANIKAGILESAGGSEQPERKSSGWFGASTTYVKSFFPQRFQEVRDALGIKPDVLKNSVEAELKESITEGKSGAFMYFTADKRFMIKTATKEEFVALFSILDKYRDHVRKYPNTLINPIVGAYEMKIYKQHVRVIVVQSVFWTGQPQMFVPNERYDVKGSWVGRYTKTTKEAGLPFLHAESTKECMKDRDIHAPLLLRADEALKLYNQLNADSLFLAENNIMDYSLLIGVKVKEVLVAAEEGASLNSMTLGHQHARTVKGPTEYCMGIIDILQQFTLRKKLEYFYLYYLRCKGKGISCVPPSKYGERFRTNIVKGLVASEVAHATPNAAAGGLVSDALSYAPPGEQLEANLVENSS